MGEESSDDNRRMDEDDMPAGEHDDDEEDASSSVSDRSRRSFDHQQTPTLKMEPLDLNRSSDVEHQDKTDQQQQQDGSNLPDDDDDLGSQASDSDSEMEDYAENLSLSKPSDDGKKVDPLLHTSGSSSQSEYAAAAAAYPGFPLSLSHAQLNPHGLVYMTSPYLQGIGSSSLHCFRLHFAKDATIGNTAGATVRQLVSLVFERVVIEDASSNEESVSTTNESFPNASKECSKLPDYPLKSLKPFAWMHLLSFK